MINPRAKIESVLAITVADFAARRAELVAYLDLNADKGELSEAVARGALTVAVSDRVWNELKKSVGTS